METTDKLQQYLDKGSDYTYANILSGSVGAMVGTALGAGIIETFDIKSLTATEFIAGASLIGGGAMGLVLGYKAKLAEKLGKFR